MVKDFPNGDVVGRWQTCIEENGRTDLYSLHVEDCVMSGLVTKSFEPCKG